jgi:hypothetical protein
LGKRKETVSQKCPLADIVTILSFLDQCTKTAQNPTDMRIEGIEIYCDGFPASNVPDIWRLIERNKTRNFLRVQAR